MDKAGVSIVVATKGRVALLRDLLNSLDEAIDNAPCPCEIILVDDSTGADATAIHNLAEEKAAHVITFGPSVSAKRNKGAEAACYDIILFLDSDCLATPHLIEEHYDRYADQAVGAVAGLLEFTGEDTWFWKVVDASPFVMWFSFPKFMPTVPWTPTANCSIRREIFLDIGEFDTGFPNKPGGEDVDLGLRLGKAGYTMTCNPDAIVYHQKDTWRSPRAMVKRLWNYGSADYFLMERHPENLFPAYPRKTLLYLLIVLMTIVLSMAVSPLVLAICAAALLFDVLLSAYVINRYDDRGVTLAQQATIQLLLINNEAGLIWRCIRNARFSLLTKQLIYLDGQAYGVADRGTLLSMVHAATLVLYAIAVFMCCMI